MDSLQGRDPIKANLPSVSASSRFLTTISDDLHGIFKAIKDNALVSKYAGGLGSDWTRVCGLDAHIRGTNGQSQGVVLFLKVANDTAIAVNPGGKRKGAVCGYLETWHIDIQEFSIFVRTPAMTDVVRMT
jgi:ribonucleoside-diphosphate reductase alpha chain